MDDIVNLPFPRPTAPAPLPKSDCGAGHQVHAFDDPICSVDERRAIFLVRCGGDSCVGVFRGVGVRHGTGWHVLPRHILR